MAVSFGIQQSNFLQPFSSHSPHKILFKTKPFPSKRSPPIKFAGQSSLASFSISESKEENNHALHKFSESLSGEWDGYGADFRPPDFSPVKLPESVVPQAFRDWEQDVFDWQSQGPSLIRPNGTLYSKTVRYIPTVGCEADAATPYSVEIRDGISDLLAFQSSGSFVATWPGIAIQRTTSAYGSAIQIDRQLSVSDNSRSTEVEHCLLGSSDLPGARRRVRIQARVRFSDRAYILSGITVYRERYEGPFSDGASLGGCASAGSSFAERPSFTTSRISGTWQTKCFVARRQISDLDLPTSPISLSFNKELVLTKSDDDSSDGYEKVIPLPIDTAFYWSSSEGGFKMKVIWMPEDDHLVESCYEICAGEEVVSQSFGARSK